MEECKKKQLLFRLRDILFLLAIFLDNGWIMFVAIVGIFVSVLLQLQNDWKVYRRFDLFTIIYICVAIALIFLIAYSIFLNNI